MLAGKEHCLGLQQPRCFGRRWATRANPVRTPMPAPWLMPKRGDDDRSPASGGGVASLPSYAANELETTTGNQERKREMHATLGNSVVATQTTPQSECHHTRSHTNTWLDALCRRRRHDNAVVISNCRNTASLQQTI